jgi:hypothetical protein
MSMDATPAPVPASDNNLSDQEMLSDEGSDYTDSTSDRHSDYIPWEEVMELQILHEATLQELLKAKNDVVWYLLHERNVLLCKQ